LHQASPGGSAAPGPGPTPPATATPTATGSPAPAPPGSSYEAEAGEAGSHGQVVGMDGASGGQVVRLSGNRSGTFVRFTDVVAAEPGPYQLTIFYFCDQGRDGTVSINNEDHLTVEFPSRGEGGTVGPVTVSTTLAAGINTIWIGTSGGSPLSLDRIALTR
ncbi:MAG: delta endotoxin C-terminal domain-containing protein, partial [Natronosporangium sp.]